MKKTYDPNLRPQLLRLEELERRELLTVSTANYQAFAEASSAAEFSAESTAFEPVALDALLTSGSDREETKSLRVTTILDVVNPYDGLISLREAIAYAGPTLGFDVTFDPSLAGKTIKLESTLELDSSVSIDASELLKNGGIVLDAHNEFQVVRTSTVGVQSVNGLTLLNGYDEGAWGGGLENLSSNLTLKNCTIANCKSDYAGGGVANLGRIVMENCVIKGNDAALWGGGLYNFGSATLRDVVVVDNTATTEYRSQGGGIYNEEDGVLTIVDSLVADNDARQIAGGVLNAGTFTATNVTIANNLNSGIDNLGTTRLYNSLVVMNKNGDCWIVNDHDSIYGYHTLSSFQRWKNANETNYVYNSSKPLFTSVSKGDYSLVDGSQAIALGVNEYAFAVGMTPDSVDLAGNPRINGVVDLGAYENDAEVPSVVVTTNEDVVDDHDYKISLREAIAYAGTFDVGMTITFDESLTDLVFTLSEQYGQLVVEKPITIDASARAADGGVALVGSGSDRVLYADCNDANGVELRYVTITGGRAENGGGVENIGALTLTNCLVVDNRAELGGGLLNEGQLILANSTVAGNNAEQGGGLVNSRQTYLYNSIVVDNGTNNVVNDDFTELYGYCSLSDFKDWTNRFDYGFVCYDYDPALPMFIDAENGDYSLALDSQAIDRGNNVYALNAGLFGDSLDLAGSRRICRLNVDLGAYEALVKERPDVVVTTLSDAVDPYDGLISLREAISYADADGVGTAIVFDDSLARETFALNAALTIDRSLSIDAANFAESGGLTLKAPQGKRAIEIAEDADVKLRYVTIVDGSAESGGAIYNEGELTLEFCAFERNLANENGGAIFNAGALTIDRTSFTNNSAFYGGAVYNTGVFISDGSSFERNVVQESGGAVYTTGSFTSTDDIFTRNEGRSSGGGVYNAGSATLTNDVFSIGYASMGGGLFNEQDGSAVMVGSLFVENFSTSGGGCYNAGSLDVVNSSVVGNYADNGEGLYNARGVANFYNSILFDPAIRAYGVVNGYRTLAIFDDWSNREDDDFDCFQYDPSQPLFVDPEQGDYSLADDSQAIDLGSNVYAYNVGLTSDSLDLAGQPRFHATIDLGAYEGQKEKRSVRVTTAEDVVDPHDGRTSLREAIDYAGDDLGRSVSFDESLAGATILLNDRFEIDKLVYIDASGLNITLDAQNKSQIFVLGENARSSIFGLTLIGGSGEDGGAIYNEGRTTLVDCVVAESNAVNGGAVYNVGTFGAIDSLFYDNSAELGGAFYNSGSNSLTNCSVVDNSAESGGGIYNDNYSFGVLNTIVVGNDGFDVALNGGSVNGYGALSSFVDWSNRLGSATNFEYDPERPLFVDAANGNYQLAFRSQATDVGFNSYAVMVGLNADSTDLIGAPRFVGRTIDLGPYETTRYPKFQLDSNEGSVFDVDKDVVLATLLTEDMNAPTFSVDLDALAVDENGQLVYLGGLTSGSYDVTVSALDDFATLTVTFVLTVEQGILAAPVANKTSGATENSLNVSFSDKNFVRGQDKYVVECSKDADFATVVGTKTFTQPGTGRVGNLDSGTMYYFRVKRVNAAGESEWSNVVSGKTLGVLGEAPTANKAGWATENSINISYSDTNFVRGQDKYVVEYSKDADFATVIGTKTFTQPGTGRVGNLDSGTTYYLRLKRVNAESSSEWSNVVSCKTLDVLGEAPTVNKAGWATGNSINISYSDTNFVRGQDKYVVEYSKDAGFATIEGSKTFAQPGTGRVSNLDSGTTYYFRLKRVNADSSSEWSNVVFATTLDVVLS